MFSASLSTLQSSISTVSGAVISLGNNVSITAIYMTNIATTAYQATTAIYQMQTAMYRTSSATLSAGQSFASLQSMVAANMSGMVVALAYQWRKHNLLFVGQVKILYALLLAQSL